MEDVSEEQIVEHLVPRTLEGSRKHFSTSTPCPPMCSRVRVHLEAKEKVLDPSFWPENIKVRSWVFRRL